MDACQAQIFFPFQLPNNTLLRTNKAAEKQAPLILSGAFQSEMYEKHTYREFTSPDKVVDAAGLPT